MVKKRNVSGFDGLTRPMTPAIEYGIAACQAMVAMLRGEIKRKEMVPFAKVRLLDNRVQENNRL